MKKDEDVIDVEEVNGVYEQIPKTVRKQQQQNKYIQNNVYRTCIQQQPQSDIEQLIGGFNEGMRLINRFIKLIR